MTFRRKIVAVLAILPSLTFCSRADPKIGLTIDYRAMHPTRVEEVWFDQRQLIGTRGSTMYVDQKSPKMDVLSSGSVELAPQVLRATWRYLYVTPGREPSQEAMADEGSWREARADVAVRSRVDAADLKLLRNDPKRHRVAMVLVFDGDHLEVRWQVERVGRDMETSKR